MPTSVFISGATGFIAQHIIKLLLSKGYCVVGSVRSAAKGDHIKKLFASEKFSYEVVSTLDAPGAFDEALKRHPEVTVFLHTASPIDFAATNPETQLLIPAVEGTKNVFKAIKVHGPQIKNVVVTSSIAANFDFSRLKDPDYTISESTWNPITWEQSKANPLVGYLGSKTFAEKAVWEFIEQEKPHYKVNTINPATVFGPQAFDSEVKDQLNASSEVINALLKLTPDSDIPDMTGTFIDVRDVARVHVAAFEKNFSKERLLLTNEPYTSRKLIDILAENFDSLKEKLPLGDGKSTSEESAVYENTKTRQLLGFPFIDLKTTVVDCVAQILNTKERAAKDPFSATGN